MPAQRLVRLAGFRVGLDLVRRDELLGRATVLSNQLEDLQFELRSQRLAGGTWVEWSARAWTRRFWTSTLSG